MAKDKDINWFSIKAYDAVIKKALKMIVEIMTKP